MKQHDLIVIGAGPGGYVATIRAAQLGLNVACIEQEPLIGGTCLRIGCIPSKVLLESSEHYAAAKAGLAEHGVTLGSVALDLPALLRRKDKTVGMLIRGVEALFKKNKITRYLGHARLTAPDRIAIDNNGQAEEISARNIIIATGSKSATLPGVELDGDLIGTSTEALSYPQVPEHLVVIGAGYIGLELGIVWQRLGAKLTVLECLDRILPGTDADIAATALKLFKRRGIEFRLNSRVTAARVQDGRCVVQAEGAEPLECSRVLLAGGRVPNTDGLGLDAVGIEVDSRGRIPVDERFATAVPGLWAIGDVVRDPMLAHKAEKEGIACVEQIVNGTGRVNYDAIPGVCYTEPEVAGVGKTEEQLREAGVEYRTGVFFFRGNGRAHALGQIDGKVKVLADAGTDRVLGVHIVGPRAGDLIAEAVLAIELGARTRDLACCHAHPTLSETVKEAALAAGGRPLHA